MTETAATRESVTRLLKTWRNGDECAGERLLPLIYQELRGLAQRELRRERKNHTLESRELVHEAFARLVDADAAWHDRSHFFALCSRTMRRILVDHARKKNRDKRGGGITVIPLDNVQPMSGDEPVDVLVIDDALNRLGQIDPRMEHVVELHYFGGLTYDEISVALGVSAATVDRDLRFAKAWLRRHLAVD